LAEASRDQKRVLLAAALGWMLDSMDVMLYALVLGEVQRAMHLSPAASGAMVSATLIAAAVGGTVFGWIADRFGRARALTISMIIYSVATALCGLTQTATELLICRVVLGLGMGGEWASGAALVAEMWPGRHRGKALAVVQSSWAVGYALAAAVVAIVMPRFGWRAVFFVGIAPALIALWVRRGLHEPEVWRESRAQPKAEKQGISSLFRGVLGYGVLICASMNAATLFAWWGLFTWVPRFLSMPVAEGGRGLSIVATSTWTIVMQVGTFLGYVVFGYLADRFSRKYTYIGYLLMGAAGSGIRAGAQSKRAAADRAPGGILRDGILQRLQRDCERAVPYRAARLGDGVCVQHRPGGERVGSVHHRPSFGAYRPGRRAVHHVCGLPAGGSDCDRAAPACADRGGAA
jgi:MFS family permease